MSVQLHAGMGVGSGGVVGGSTVGEVAGQQAERVRTDQITGPEPVEKSSKKLDATTATLIQFNKLARDLVAKTKTPPPNASRMYAMLSMAQLQAIEATQGHKGADAKAAVAAASTKMLKAFFPDESANIDVSSGARHGQQRLMVGDGVSSGKRIGERVASEVLASRAQDGHDAKWTGEVPAPGPGVWRSTMDPPKPPLFPQWGDVTPFFMPAKGAKDRPTLDAPPKAGTPAYQSALAEVRQFSDTRTEEQLRIALFWADNAGTATPPGHWNQIASDFLLREKASPMQAAKVLAALNTAMADAGIACWEVKYQHWLIRPSQDDTKIVVPEKLGLPNFPAYVSGHASFSGAAAEVLGHFFPKKADEYKAMAEEAAISRVYGGIHFRFDGDQGLNLGRQAAKFTLESLKA
jgi:hypothetical protein